MAHPPRTGTQKALRITSIIMIIFGVLVALSGAIIIASGAAADSLGLNDAVNFQGTETTAGILTMAVGILVLIMGALQLIVAFLGLRASNDASKVGPYRALSWGISIVILAMIVYNWFLGGTFLDDPFLLIGDVVYLLVCTTLADVVKKEHDRGIVGEAKAEVERSGSQKALRVISIVLVVFAVISIVLGLAFLALIAAGLGTDAVNAMDPNDPDLVAGIAVGLVLGVVLVGSGVVDLVVGALGLRGARDPRKVKPFFVLCVIGLAIEVAGDVWLAAQGMLSSIGASGAVELLVIGACTWLAYDIMRQSRGICWSSAPARGWPTTSCARAAASRRKRELPFFREGRRSLDGLHHISPDFVARIGFAFHLAETLSFAKI